MKSAIRGRQLIEALEDINEPAQLTDVVSHVAQNSKQSLTSIMKRTKAVLDAGVRYGYIEKDNDHYYLPEDPYEDRANNASEESDSEVEAEANPSDCYGNQRGMRRRMKGEKRIRRSRSRSERRRSERRSSRRHRRR